MKTLRFELKRPSDDGYDGETLVHHRCEESRRLARSNPDADVLVFWPYAGGQGMPTGVPWVEQSQDPCGACRKYVTAWFSWKSDLIFL